MSELKDLAQRLRHHVEALARTPRLPGTPEHREAASYIRGHLEDCGFTVRDGAFREAGFVGLNLLTEPLPGHADLPLLIVGAHFDTKPGSPGADTPLGAQSDLGQRDCEE